MQTKVCLVKATVFPVVTYGCESWTIKKAKHWRNDAFALRCWRSVLRVPWTTRRSNQLILKEISSEYSLEGLMLKLNLQYFGHLIRRAISLEKTLMLGKTEGRRRRRQQRMRQLNGIINSMDVSWSKHGESGGKESETTEWLNNNKKWLERTNEMVINMTVCLHLPKWPDYQMNND